ncbi:hypothetical protein ACM66B_005704 [Microbotryomycetes sp. NB124-2]
MALKQSDPGNKSTRPRPTLPLSVFQSLASEQANNRSQQRRRHPREIVDAHIHLWTQKQLDRKDIRWPLDSAVPQWQSAHTLEQFAQLSTDALASDAGWSKNVGAVFVQAEVEHDDAEIDGSGGGWDTALNEIVEVCDANQGSPVPLLALAPWAPVHQGPVALSAFFDRISRLPEAKHMLDCITSCRFLLQDCPRGFMLQDRFVEGLAWLGKRNVAFEMTVDATKVEGVLEDAVEAISRLRQLEQEEQRDQPRSSQKQTRIVLDHFAKPNLVAEPVHPPAPHQSAYIQCLFELSLLPQVYVKLSGLLDSASPALVKDAFAEYQTQKHSNKGSAFLELRRRVLVYLEPAMEAFGDSRIMIGSDWPMFRAKTCRASASQTRDAKVEAAAWLFEMELYRSALVEIGCDGDALDKIFATNAKEFYRISAP